jgi:hypothetical protein
MLLQHFYGKVPHPLLWTRSLASDAEFTVSGTHNHLNYCLIFKIFTQFTEVAAGWGLETHDYLLTYLLHAAKSLLKS